MRRAVKTTVVTVAAIAATAAFAVAGTGSADAAAPAVTFHCTGQPGQPGRTCTANVLHDGTRLFRPDGTLGRVLSAGTQVTVTCYYRDDNGNFQDHVTHENIPSPITGHIADVSIDFGGNDPNASPISLDHC